MGPYFDELRSVVDAMARLVAETATAVARTGAFDGHDPDHVSELLSELEAKLRAAHLRGAHHHILEAQHALRNEERAPRLLQSRPGS